MKIDLRKLYTAGSLALDENIIIPQELYSKMNVRKMENVHVSGKAFINYEENIGLELNVKGTLIMACAVSLEDVSVDFNTKIEEEILEKDLKDNFTLDLLDILWENIVLEIPIRVVKKGIQITDLQGEGWELDTEK